MRKLVLVAAVTLENFIAGQGGDMAWLRDVGLDARSMLLGSDLNLKSCAPIANGCILATYEPA